MKQKKKKNSRNYVGCLVKENKPKYRHIVTATARILSHFLLEATFFLFSAKYAKNINNNIGRRIIEFFYKQ